MDDHDPRPRGPDAFGSSLQIATQVRLARDKGDLHRGGPSPTTGPVMDSVRKGCTISYQGSPWSGRRNVARAASNGPPNETSQSSPTTAFTARGSAHGTPTRGRASRQPATSERGCSAERSRTSMTIGKSGTTTLNAGIGVQRQRPEARVDHQGRCHSRPATIARNPSRRRSNERRDIQVFWRFRCTTIHW